MTLQFDRDFNAVPERCERLSPRIRRVLCGNPGPFTFTGTSTFIIGTRRVAIIDPGPDDSAHLAALLDAVRGETVSHILITHTHLDHSSMAAKLKAATGAPTCAYPGTSPSEGSGLDASIDRDFKPDLALADGEGVSGPGWSLEAVFTPGHKADHMSFALAEEKALFVGDHVMAWSTTVIAPPEGNMGQYFASLQKLLDRDDRVYHPAHGPSRADPLPLVRATLAHRRMREAAILRRLEAGDQSIGALVAAIYVGLDPRLAGAAALSTRAHLDHLIEQGRARAEGDGRFSAAA